MTRVLGFAILGMLGAVTCSAQHINGEATYISFSVPGAQGTYPMAINASMVSTGYYYASSSTTRGFVREADGTIATFGVKGGVWTEPESINAAGDVTGFYELAAGVAQGFIRYANGTIVTFDPPQTSNLLPPQAQPLSINEFDEITGNYLSSANLVTSAFARSRTGAFSTIDLAVPYTDTVATSINASGAIVGFYAAYPQEKGYLIHSDGYRTEFSIPAITQEESMCSSFTIPEAINTSGMVAGWYLRNSNNCATSNTGGFVLNPNGSYTVFTLPGTLGSLTLPGFPSRSESLTIPHWISLDDNGDVAGSYTDNAGVQHGFVRNPYGTITTFDPPEGQQTTSTSINNLGDVAGYYHNTSAAPVGFIRIPQSSR